MSHDNGRPDFTQSQPPMHAPVADHLQWLSESMAETAANFDSVTLDHDQLVGLADYYRQLAIKARFLHMAAPLPDTFQDGKVVRLQRRPRPRQLTDSPTPPNGGSVA
ncbi:hypothetical protein [Ferrovibrio sp.]|uniref:hypothetical protein n=1 Tax=Ferrovibrio sp. TaxID=1917215 RepID=UPI0035B19ED0